MSPCWIVTSILNYLIIHLYFKKIQDEARVVSELSDSDELDNTVLALSKEVIDDFPVSDPRWAESIPAGKSSCSLVQR